MDSCGVYFRERSETEENDHELNSPTLMVFFISFFFLRESRVQSRLLPAVSSSRRSVVFPEGQTEEYDAEASRGSNMCFIMHGAGDEKEEEKRKKIEEMFSRPARSTRGGGKSAVSLNNLTFLSTST